RFFLTDSDGTIAGTSATLIVTYTTPTSSVSGVILDVDGQSTGGATPGDEQWTIEAVDPNGQVLQTLVITAGDPGTGDGAATPWSFDVGAALISQVRFINTGTALAAASGFALDNFYARGQQATGAGIVVENNASPTLLNNILANLDTGIEVDPSSQTTVVGGSLYRGNSTDTVGVATEDFPLYL
ncbi:MAG: hypothetical protein JJ992_23595, partial [Planctomycetes bacterium]|nr:hypothetical protein [Planctomycetota bacterium]